MINSIPNGRNRPYPTYSKATKATFIGLGLAVRSCHAWATEGKILFLTTDGQLVLEKSLLPGYILGLLRFWD